MQIPVKPILRLDSDSFSRLLTYRMKRSFAPEQYVEKKINLLREYCEKGNINSLVVLLSGGVDSAVVAGIVDRYARFYPDTKVHFVTIPAHNNEGVTRQQETVRLAQQVGETFNRSVEVLPLEGILHAVGETLGEGSAWVKGQTVSYIRTATAYSYVSRLWSNGERAIIVGTINLDEGAYVGYVGKAGDGMVDVQLIGDIHKSEVYACARSLGVPDDVLTATPQGDMYHGGADEEVFGCEYDAIELHHAVKSGDVQEPDSDVWREISGHIEELHAYNAHKYDSASQAVHLNVMPVNQYEGSWVFNRKWSR